jgi:predicted SpoU family rRNA methylase
MTALTRRQYGDPLEILLRRESRTCKGCKHVQEAWGKPYCVKHDKPAVKRCKDYKETD